MEKQIFVEPLQKSFVVGLKDANRQKRNRSYSNASPCCKHKLVQEKHCGNCKELVATADCQHKIVKIGKTEHVIDSSAFQQVQDSLEQMENVTLHTFLNEEPTEAQDRYESLVYALPVDKKEAQYKELAEVLKGKTAIGKGAFRHNEFQVVVSVGSDGVIRVRKLVEESQRYDFSPASVQEKLDTATVNPQVLEVERQIIDKQTTDAFDVKEFQDSRTEYEEKVIEDYVLNGKVPEEAPRIQQQQETDELERLKALVEA